LIFAAQLYYHPFLSHFCFKRVKKHCVIDATIIAATEVRGGGKEQHRELLGEKLLL